MKRAARLAVDFSMLLAVACAPSAEQRVADLLATRRSLITIPVARPKPKAAPPAAESRLSVPTEAELQLRWTARVRDAASLALDCDRGQLNIEPAACWQEFRVSGCGKSMRYECASRQTECCPFVGESRLEDKAPYASRGALPELMVRHVLIQQRHLMWSCFERARDVTQSRASSGYIAGVLSFDLRVDSAGHVVEVIPVRDSVADAVLLQCATKVLKLAEFPKPIPSGDVYLSGRWEFLEWQAGIASCAPNPTIKPLRGPSR